MLFRSTHKTRPPLYPIKPQNTSPFETIALDFITKLPESRGFDTILTITDHDCSKAVLFIPCREEIDGPGVALLRFSPPSLCLPFCYDCSVMFSKCQSQLHMTVDACYIKWTAFLIIVVARIPLRQSYLITN